MQRPSHDVRTIQQILFIEFPLSLVSPAQEGAPKRALLVHNFAAETGFAWRFIDELYDCVAETLKGLNIEAISSYPVDAQSASPDQDRDGDRVVVWNASDRGLLAAWRSYRLLRALNVRLVYMSDQPLLRWEYFLWRLAGVRKIIVHDHTSGVRPVPTGMRRFVKSLSWRVPGLGVDLTIGVSDFVIERLRRIGLVPYNRIERVRNGVRIPEARTDRAFDENSGGAQALTVLAVARATEVKGIHVLLTAWQQLIARWPDTKTRPRLRYAGDGPMLDELRAQVVRLGLSHSVEMLGYREDVTTLFATADLCVVPSVWAEAFCLVAAESMSFGVPVIGTNLGAIPEVVGPPTAGRLVPAGNADALADAILAHLARPAAERAAEGARGRERACREFDLNRTKEEMRQLMLRIAEPLAYQTER